MRKYRLVFVVLVLAAVWLAKAAVPSADQPGEMNLSAFGRLPVVYQGRVKPFDTLARNSLVLLADRQTFRDADGRRRPAIQWLLEVMAETEAAAKHKVFRIVNLQLLSALGLERRPGYRYAYEEFQDQLPVVEAQAERARALQRDQRDLYNNKVLEFTQKVALARILADSHHIPTVSEEPEQARRDLFALQRRLSMLERFSLPHAVPSLDADREWKPFLRAAWEDLSSGVEHPAVRSLTAILQAYRKGDAAQFNRELSDYRALLAKNPPQDAGVLGFEAFFNHFEPFYHCSVLYVVALVLGFVSWLGFSSVLNRTAFWLMVLTFVVHTLAIAARVYISGYPPITNLYGTAVFIGWGCVLLGLILELIYPMGVGNLVAAVSGFLTLLIAHFLAGDGDTLEMMQAVLDTKFWLATHVVIINFGYSATFLAGGLAVLYILRGVLSRSLDLEVEKTFGRMIYGIVCFALLLSFVGTVLGGLWADDSWGRFWGWDPKENGALMIVLWNVLIVHARWGGMIRTRGLAILAVFGNIVTSWSWFGVNQLGVGLHSYGFTESVSFWLILFALSQCAVIGLGLLPRTAWRSTRVMSREAASTRTAGDEGLQPS